MLMTRWRPFGDALSEMNRLQHEMNRLFNRFGATPPEEERRVAPASPAIDLWQDDDNLYVEAELPGLAIEDIEIYVVGGNQLTLKGRREGPSVENGTWHRRERHFGGFSRAMTLPSDVQADKVEASLRDGVLTITLPKLVASRPRRIAVNKN